MRHAGVSPDEGWGPRTVYRYIDREPRNISQEADRLVGEGWEVFQVVPVGRERQRSYVVARRPVGMAPAAERPAPLPGPL